MAGTVARLGIGVGWNPVEFVGLNENFGNRGRRSEEQVEVMKALWADPHVTFKGKFHTIEDAGINPLPLKRSIPVWYGGHADATLHRVVKWGDGWMPLAYGPGEEAKAAIAKLRTYAEAAGRDPEPVLASTRVVSVGIGGAGRVARCGAFLEILWRHLSDVGDLFRAWPSASYRR